MTKKGDSKKTPGIGSQAETDAWNETWDNLHEWDPKLAKELIGRKS